MKKFFALMIALAMALGCVTALAETTLTEYAVISEDLNAGLIYNSNLLSLRSGNETALATLDGTPLTEYAYHTLQAQMGWILAARVGDDNFLFNGLLAADGSVVVPPDYNDVDMLNENWAVGVHLEKADKSDYDYSSFTSDDVYKITTVDIYYLPTAQLVATLPREKYLKAGAYDQYINVTDRSTGLTTTYDAAFNPLQQVDSTYDQSMLPQYSTFNDNGVQGLKAPDGTVIIEPTYEVVYPDVKGNYFKVGDYEHYGLCDLNGNLVIPVEYDYIQTTEEQYVINGYASVKKNDMLGFVNVQTGEVAMSNFTGNDAYNRGMTMDHKDGDDTVIFAADGVETRLAGIQSAYPCLNGLFYRISNSDGKYGLIDWHGNEIIPCEYNDVNMTADGKYVVTRYTYRDPMKVYALSSDLLPAAEEAAEPAADAAPEAELPESQPTDDSAAAETGSANVNAESSGATVKDLLNSAMTLLKADPVANSAAAVSLMHSAATQLSDNDTAHNLLNSAISLLNDNPTDNASAVITLLETALPLL